MIGLIVVVLMALYFHKSKQPQIPLPTTSTPDETKSVLAGVNKPISAFTEAEKSELAKRFNERFKPAIEKWCNAYAGHIPFNATDVTLDKFHSTLGGGMFTFMVGSATLTISDNRHGTKVFYMMTNEGAKKLNSIPLDGQPRNLTFPVIREEVLKMAEADTGLKYELKDIDIKPTAAACSIDGGAFVEVGMKYENGMQLILPDNLSFVVGADGKLIAYQH